MAFIVLRIVFLNLFLISCSVTTPKVIEKSGTQRQVALEQQLDLNNLNGNVRFVIARALPDTNFSFSLSAIQIGKYIDQPRTILSDLFQINLKNLTDEKTVWFKDAKLQSGEEYSYLKIRSVTVPMVKFSTLENRQYVVVIAIGANPQRQFVEYVAEVKNGAISKTLYVDMEGTESWPMPLHSPGTKTRSVCGNGIIEAGEQCDDGNQSNFDGCTPDCQFEAGFPLCSWSCDDPVCPAFCKPVCKPPRCQIQCGPLGSSSPGCVCDVKCEKPLCEIRCPSSDTCESDVCPQCETVCQPANCSVSCQGETCTLPTPNCSVLCEETKCNWECQKPTKCREPTCNLTCQSEFHADC